MIVDTAKLIKENEKHVNRGKKYFFFDKSHDNATYLSVCFPFVCLRRPRFHSCSLYAAGAAGCVGNKPVLRIGNIVCVPWSPMKMVIFLKVMSMSFTGPKCLAVRCSFISVRVLGAFKNNVRRVSPCIAGSLYATRLALPLWQWSRCTARRRLPHCRNDEKKKTVNAPCRCRYIKIHTPAHAIPVPRAA